MTGSPARAARCFVVPALSGAITGGTLYNCELLGALGELTPILALEPSAAEPSQMIAAAPSTWLDSLYLERAALVRRRVPRRLGLIAHYLPSFVARERAVPLAELSPLERAALGVADAFLVTSDFMRDALEPLVAPEKPIFVVPPGTRALERSAAQEEPGELHAIVVANVVPGKGIESLLGALRGVLRERDRLRLSIVGSLDADRAYAERCQRLVRESPLLEGRVQFLGAQPHAMTLSLMARATLLISASVMESFGMALADARVIGMPILARAGGNVASHVDPRAGGQLLHTALELAQACVELARSSAVLGERTLAARERASPPRSWQAAAAEFQRYLEDWEK